MNHKNTVYGPQKHYDFTEQSLGEVLFKSLKKKDPTEIILIDSSKSKHLNCDELLRSSIILSLNLSSKLNVGKDSVITLIAPNSWKYALTLFASLFNGVNIHLIYQESTQWELQRLYTQCKPDVVFCTSDHLEDNLQLKNKGFWEGKIVLLDGGRVENNVLNFEELLTNRTTEEITNFYPQQFDWQKTALVLQSSGTTGMPKIINLSHQNLVINFLDMGDPDNFAITKGSKTIGYLPLSHIFGINILLGYILFDAVSILMEKFEPLYWLQIIENQKITKIYGTPAIAQFLMASSLAAKYDLSSIEEIFISASNLTVETCKDAMESLGIEIRQAYGMTEACGGIVITPRNCTKIGTIGKLRPNTEMQIRDIRTGKPLGPNKVGEMYFKSPTVVRDGLQKDGFFKTGDIGYYDNEEFFYFVDRLKEIIKYKGFQVSPRELEQLLEEHPAVKEAAIIGKPDDRYGELPVAFVVKQSDQEVNEEELIQYIAEKVAPHKRLSGGVKFVDEIAKNKLGKKMKHHLKELL